MAMDGKLLARAREQIEQRKAANAVESARRTKTAYERIPRIEAIDRQLRQLFAEVVSVTLRDHLNPETAIARVDRESSELRAEKAELLVAHGLPADYLEDIVTCPICSDSGYDRSGRPCRCLREIYAREVSRELSSLMRVDRDDFKDFDLSYYSTAVDPRQGISPRECMGMVLETCRRYAENFGKNSPNLLFQGGTGLGKTLLGACIAKVVAEKGHSVVYDTAVAAFEAFESQRFGRGSMLAEQTEEKLRRMLSCDLLILDDLGTEMTTTFTQSALYTLINTRLNEGRKTIISTNLTKEELAGRYTAPIISRLEGEYDTLLFLGRDIRQQKKERRWQ